MKASFIMMVLLMFMNVSAYAYESHDRGKQGVNRSKLEQLCEHTSYPLAPRLNPNHTPVEVHGPNQASFNCFGWQLFIDLNWPASKIGTDNPDPADFGRRGDLEAVVWENYQSIYEIFLPDGSKPVWHGDSRQRVSSFHPAAYPATKSQKERIFSYDRDTEQVFHTWLTDQNHNRVYYEIRVNQDEFDYINDAGIYNTEGILKFEKDIQTTPESRVKEVTEITEVTKITKITKIAGGKEKVAVSRVTNVKKVVKPPAVAGVVKKTKKNVSFPDGASEAYPLGAIEVKAAWQIIPPGKEYLFQEGQAPKKTGNKLHKKWIYKISKVKIKNQDGNIEEQTVALIGLHIVKKTPAYPQWIWATFEHVYNVPDKDNVNSAIQYSLFDQNKGMEAKPNWKSPPADDQPVQVVRETPIDSKYAMPINRAMHALITKHNPDSVWQYYNLVTTQWSKSLPLPHTKYLIHSPPVDPEPPVASNTTMETYLQTKKDKHAPKQDDPKLGGSFSGKSSCIGCHLTLTVKLDQIDGKCIDRECGKEKSHACPTDNKRELFMDYSGIFPKGLACRTQ